ncbi:MAG: hypothetical protein WC936_01945 [Candidatus Nanoarchaeia archaeon]
MMTKAQIDFESCNFRDELILFLIKQMNCASLETLTIVSGITKEKLTKVIKRLQQRKLIKIATTIRTNYYGVV